MIDYTHPARRQKPSYVHPNRGLSAPSQGERPVIRLQRGETIVLSVDTGAVIRSLRTH